MTTTQPKNKIEIEKSPRYNGAPDEDCIIRLVVNGYCIGTYYGGKEKKYENPEKWAKQMIPKRRRVIQRNIIRLENELRDWEKELRAINN